jgi:hypothetical protein
MSEAREEKPNESEEINARKKAFATALMTLIEPHAPAINEKLQGFGKWLQGMSTKTTPLIQSLATIDWETLSERLKALPKHSSEAMQIASRQGWFFNWQGSLKQTVQMGNLLHDADGADAVDQILMDHYNECWDGYLELLAIAFPARNKTIEAAVKAHREFAPAGYSLSIPVFLAQADGIFSEVTGTPSAMDKVKRSSAIKGSVWVQDQIGEDQTAIDLLFPILQLHELDILKSRGARAEFSRESGKVFDALNRHQVMHGEISDYGTELNSVKAFSFLVFVALHVPDIIRSAKERSENHGDSISPEPSKA